MKARFIKLAEPDRQSFTVKNERIPFFYNPYHYHPELELTLIQHGKGTRFIGDSIEPFFEEDLVLVGANLPHLWRSGNEYYQPGTTLFSQAIVVHFSPTVWGGPFLALPELEPIQQMLIEAQHGIRFTGAYRHHIAGKMYELTVRQGADRLGYFIQLLDFIAACPMNDKRLLTSRPFTKQSSQQDSERIDRVYHFTLQHFKDCISLDQVADIANLNRTAFCRYFRSHTRKSYWQVLIEIRIGHACKLLISGNMPVYQVALESGYSNLSVFNEHFKRITGVTPLKYKKEYR